MRYRILTILYVFYCCLPACLPAFKYSFFYIYFNNKKRKSKMIVRRNAKNKMNRQTRTTTQYYKNRSFYLCWCRIKKKGRGALSAVPKQFLIFPWKRTNLRIPINFFFLENFCSLCVLHFYIYIIVYQFFFVYVHSLFSQHRIY